MVFGFFKKKDNKKENKNSIEKEGFSEIPEPLVEKSTKKDKRSLEDEKKKLEKEIEELKKKLNELEIDKTFYEEEAKKYKTLFNVKETLKNLDNKIVLIFDPKEVFKKVMATADPEYIEELAYRLYMEKREKDLTMWEEINNILSGVVSKLIVTALLVSLVISALYFATKIQNPEPKVITQEKVIVVPSQYLDKFMQKYNFSKGQVYYYTYDKEKKQEKLVPYSQIKNENIKKEAQVVNVPNNTK